MNNTKVGNAKDNYITMPMYNLIEYSYIHLKAYGSSWTYYRDTIEIL